MIAIRQNTILLSVDLVEFNQLMEELKPLKFRSSGEVSKYIMRNQLGYKYPNISGIVRMERDGEQWDFKGGFPKHVYAKICKALELDCARSRAKAVGFTSFSELNVGRT